MDEMLDIITGLWTRERFSYDGAIFRIPEVSLVPRPVQRPHPPIWIAGGTVPSGTSRHITEARGYTPARSLTRAARMNGLITAYRASPALDMSELRRSWSIVEREARALGRDPAGLTFAHQDHFHVDLDPTPARLREVFARYTLNPYESAAPLYLMGHPDDLVPRIQARIDAGVTELLLNPLTPDPRQLDLFAKEIRSRLHPSSG
jgi:alkanesulfonate monooxygenase SsuD/methylene tetrahydromethanopterin reductase-like flavin-dependent oxidoreductase (luciferase family)